MAGAHHGVRRRGWIPVALTVVIGFALGATAAWSAGQLRGAPPAEADTADASASAAASAAASPVPQVSAPAVGSSEPADLPSSGFDSAQFSIDDADSPWVVVNKLRPLDPHTFVPDDLVSADGVSFSDGGTLRPEAATALSEMASAASEAGVPFRVSSAYRSYDRQADIYNTYVAESGTVHADEFSARPGYSEHQTGLSADLYDTDACRLKACFGDSDAGRWVAEHGADYGFILRYPEGKQDVTGYKYEPWHVRYVGVDLAVEMRSNGVQTLEEFFGLPPAPDYSGE